MQIALAVLATLASLGAVVLWLMERKATARANDLAGELAVMRERFRNVVDADAEAERARREAAEQRKRIAGDALLSEQAHLHDFGVYEPRYSFPESADYKAKLDEVRAAQKTAVKNGAASPAPTDWTVNGDKQKGAKMVRDRLKLMFRAFNGVVVAPVRYALNGKNNHTFSALFATYDYKSQNG